MTAGTRRRATYTNLDPGTYTFRVRASNSDGVWTRTPTSLRVVIAPPWWETWWAYVLYAALAIGALAYGLRQERARVVRREREERPPAGRVPAVGLPRLDLADEPRVAHAGRDVQDAGAVEQRDARARRGGVEVADHRDDLRVGDRLARGVRDRPGERGARRVARLVDRREVHLEAPRASARPAELEALAVRLDDLPAPMSAALVREAAEVYAGRGLLR